MFTAKVTLFDAAKIPLAAEFECAGETPEKASEQALNLTAAIIDRPTSIAWQTMVVIISRAANVTVPASRSQAHELAPQG